MARWCRGYWSSQGRVEKGWNWVAECNIERPSQMPSLVVFIRHIISEVLQYRRHPFRARRQFPLSETLINGPMVQRVLVIPGKRGYWSSLGRVEKGWNWVAECNIQRPSQTPSLFVIAPRCNCFQTR